MIERAVAITLKIPDNEALTALSALQRLGVPVETAQRADVWLLGFDGSGDALAGLVRRDETLFNPNKHVLEVLGAAQPRHGELWIESLEGAGRKMISGIGAARRLVAWRLTAASAPAAPGVLHAAAEALLCNPAIERALF